MVGIFCVVMLFYVVVLFTCYFAVCHEFDFLIENASTLFAQVIINSHR